MTWCRLLLRSFNPRLRVGGDSGTIRIGARKSSFQSTPPRGRRLFCRVVAVIGDAVSIHASAWEATRPDQLRIGSIHVSIHASAWEATGLRALFAKIWTVSIHASAWEATEMARPRTSSDVGFNPRLRVGGDGWPMTGRAARPKFQSTPPRGRRRYPGRHACHLPCFNPRLRVGGDTPGMEPLYCWGRFQSTPPRGRRPGILEIKAPRIGFQSTPPRGRRHLPSADIRAPMKFQSTPPRGRRPCADTSRP